MQAKEPLPEAIDIAVEKGGKLAGGESKQSNCGVHSRCKAANLNHDNDNYDDNDDYEDAYNYDDNGILITNYDEQPGEGRCKHKVSILPPRR